MTAYVMAHTWYIFHAKNFGILIVDERSKVEATLCVLCNIAESQNSIVQLLDFPLFIPYKSYIDSLLESHTFYNQISKVVKKKGKMYHIDTCVHFLQAPPSSIWLRVVL